MSNSNTLSIDTVAGTRCATGENPLWHADEKRLYWTDIPAGRLYRFDPVARRYERCYTGRPVGGFTIQADGALLLFRDRGNIVRFHNDRITDTLVESIPELEETRFNDVIADPCGRVFAGSMSVGSAWNGRLYRFDQDGSRQVVGDGYGTPNGMGFTADGKTMYFTDSRARCIYRFRYDQRTGRIDQRTLFTETAETDAARLGRSDGMTVDSDGNLWSARWDGGCILCYEPQGVITTQIPMPARKISSVAFGGEQLDELYATSATGGTPDGDDPHAGALFRLYPGVTGRPEYRSCLGNALFQTKGPSC